MKKWLLLLLALVLAVPTGAPAAPWLFPVPSGLTAGDTIYATNTYTLSARSAIVTDGSMFLPAADFCRVASGVSASVAQGEWDVASRISSSVWAMARQANTLATETYWIRCGFNSWLQRSGSYFGIKITSLGLSYQILATGTANPGLASHYWGRFGTAAYADNTDVVLGTDLAVTPSLATTYRVPGRPHLTTVTILSGNQAYLPYANNTELTMEYVVSIAPSVVYRLYGVQVNFTRRDN